MDATRLRIKRPALLMAFILFFGILACGSEDEARVVDFTHTKQVPQPGMDAGKEGKILRIAVGAMVSPQPTLVYYQRTLDYLSKKLGLQVEMIQKKTYAEINAMLDQGSVDVAFICSGPYAKGANSLGLRLLAAPEVSGSSRYRSYLIVNKTSKFMGLADLRGKVFAFTDPDSNSGHLVPSYWLYVMGESPEKYFAKVVYTHGHDNSILAVAKGLVDAAAVDSLVWKYHMNNGSGLAAQTKVIKRSDSFGIPPVVASRHLAPPDSQIVRDILLSMHLDPEGRQLLNELSIDRFVPASDDWYEPVRSMLAALGK